MKKIIRGHFVIIFIILFLSSIRCKKEEVPVLTTTTVSNITATTASSGGNITDEGSSTVMARGVCWSTGQKPTISDNKTTDDTGAGSFVSSITGLTVSTTYYVSAYAINASGTGYGVPMSFTSLPAKIPVLTTANVTTITQNSASCGGTITSDGAASITARGVCWSTTSNPTTSDNITLNGSGIGAFSSSITGLTANTIYYLKAYATNSARTAYGNEISFTTLQIVTTPSVSTTAVSLFTSTSATVGGNVTSNGNATVIERGIYYGTSANPQTTGTKFQIGNGTGLFSNSLSGLIPNTTYYIKSYATNSAGTAYGNEVSFTTIAASLPTLTTIVTFSSITATSCNSGGNVSSDGMASVTARGVCWSTTSNPTTSDNITLNGLGIGAFSSSIVGLSANTTYYVRAYATNIIGTAYGNEIDFTTTFATVPTITTTTVSNITQFTATSGGNITSDGGAPVTERGICWDISASFALTGNHIGNHTTDGIGTGIFTSTITGLTLSTIYLRAYATNSIGTAYGNEISFTTASVAIGENFQGGKVAYILQPSDPGYIAGETHGLIAASSDIGFPYGTVPVQWGCYGTVISGADGTAIGSGNQNTIDITNGCSTTNTTTINGISVINMAAKICADLSLGIYNDWYLPSKDELYKLYLNRTAIGGFAETYYWSSTEFDSNSAWFQYFSQGSQLIRPKNLNASVRAVRSF